VSRELGDRNELLAAGMEGWHLCVLVGLTTPQAAAATDGTALLLALLAVLRGRTRTAATLTAAATVGTALSLLH
jgi:hypothetical protein